MQHHHISFPSHILIIFIHSFHLFIFSFLQPAFSIGNVPQLCVDLLVATFNLEHICSLDHSSLIPICGNDAYTPLGTNVLCTSADVYGNDSFCVLQMRSPPAPGFHNVWAAALVEWLTEMRVGSVCLLLSANKWRVIGHDLFVPRVCTTPALPEDKVPSEWEHLSADLHDYALRKGTVSFALEEECKTRGLPMATITIFCGEGDNVEDAARMTLWADEFVTGTQRKDLKMLFPPSWNASTFWGGFIADQAEMF